MMVVVVMMMMIVVTTTVLEAPSLTHTSTPGYSRPMRVCDNCHSSIATGIPYGGGALGEIKSAQLVVIPSPDKSQHLPTTAAAASALEGQPMHPEPSPYARSCSCRRFKPPPADRTSRFCVFAWKG
jgi:hypothetical protein